MDCAYQFDNFRAVAITVVIAIVIAALLLMANLAYSRSGDDDQR